MILLAVGLSVNVYGQDSGEGGTNQIASPERPEQKKPADSDELTDPKTQYEIGISMLLFATKGDSPRGTAIVYADGVALLKKSAEQKYEPALIFLCKLAAYSQKLASSELDEMLLRQQIKKEQ